MIPPAAILSAALALYGDQLWPMVNETLTRRPDQRDLVVFLDLLQDEPFASVGPRDETIRALRQTGEDDAANQLDERNKLEPGADHVVHVIVRVAGRICLGSVPHYLLAVGGVA